MASLFKMGLDSTMLVTQRAETQQNMRAAIDLMVKDISMAGAGLAFRRNPVAQRRRVDCIQVWL